MLHSINQKTVALSLGIALLIAVCCSIGAWVAVDLSSALDRSALTTKILQTHMDADMMHDALRADVLAAVAARDPAFGISLDDVRKDLAGHSAQFRKDIGDNEAAADTANKRAVLQSLKTPLNAYIGGAEHMLELIARNPAAAAQAMPEFLQQFEVLEGAMASASQQFEAEQQVDILQGRDHGSLGRTFMLGLLVCGIIVAGLLAWLVRASLVRPLTRMTHAIQQLASGNVEISVERGRRDEIGLMAVALQVLKQGVAERRRLADDASVAHEKNQEELRRVEDAFRVAAQEQTRVVECLGKALSQLATGDLTTRVPGNVSLEYQRLKQDFNIAIESLQQALQKVSVTVGGIRSGVGEIGQAADDLSRRTEQQAASLEETAAALDEITATVRKTSEGASHARRVVGTAKVDAERSGDVVREAVDAMGNIEKSSGQITQIIGVIDEIAFQTNLLALNAGVEAARAGDAGRGFAVVASEVRALAQRSADAAKEIKTLISSSSAQVEQGVDLVGRTGEALQRIIKQVGEIDGIVNEIAASAQEQATALNQVNTAVNQMDQVTQQNAAMVEQSSAASHTLTQEAEELAGLIAQFQVGQTTVAPERQVPRARATPKGAPTSKSVVSLRTVGRGGAAAKAAAPAEGSWTEF